MNENRILEIVESFKIKSVPEYREFTCAKCQKQIRKAWHVWLNKGGFKTEIHFCKKCFKKLRR